MEYSALYLIVLLLLLPFWLFLTRRSSKRLPPGSMGLPIVGHSLGLLKAMRTNKGEKWLQEKVRKFGPISKLSLFGKPTVFLHGPAAHKFVYTNDGNALVNHQPASIRRICGEKNLFELSREDHRRVREALMMFLKPEALKQYVGRMGAEIQMYLKKHWEGKQEIASTGEGDLLVKLFETDMEGMLSVPIDFPFTRFRSSLQASAKAKAIIVELIHEKREALEKYGASSSQDLITCLFSIRDEKNSPVMSDEEIIDNAFIVMIGGHETSSILLTLLVRLLAKYQSVRAKVAQEHEEIAKTKGSGKLLTWDDLANMKYTWRVATETLRMHPPVFCSFRQTVKDIEYGGYLIPKGWQVYWAACMTHMDENIYPDPSNFDPSRFEQGTRTPFSFVAFGGGARICPGMEFSRVETLAMMHYLVTGFNWKITSKDDSFYRDPMPVFKDGLQIKLEDKVSVM